MNKVGRWSRHSVGNSCRQDKSGSLFISKFGQVDVSGIHILHAGLDTVRQLYTGQLLPEVVADISRAYEQGFGECLEFGGVVWMVGSGGKSGYQYRLQNSDLGLIVFVKSRYIDLAEKGSHVKIECSPHWIHERDIDGMGRELDSFALCFLDSPAPSGVAVHLCADIQGWSPNDDKEDFLDCLVTRARRITSHRHNKVEYMDMGEVASTYGKNQSYLLGSASSVQMGVYCKSIQAKATDKLAFWEHVWFSACGDDFDKPLYDDKKPVWRVEFRFHHTVLAEFKRGAVALATGENNYYFTSDVGYWEHITGVVKQLQKLWSYGLDSFRLELSAENLGRCLHPVWQYLLEDVKHGVPVGDLFLKRLKKKPGEGNEKNVLLAVGNLLSVYARNRFTAGHAFRCLKRSGVYDDLYNYMARRAHFRCERFSEGQIYDFVRDGLLRRTLLGRAA